MCFEKCKNKWQRIAEMRAEIKYNKKSQEIASVSDDGDRFWHLNGKLHNDSGPAVILADGSRFWYLNGKLHNESGPAVEFAGDGTYYLLNDKEYEDTKKWKRRCFEMSNEKFIGEYPTIADLSKLPVNGSGYLHTNGIHHDRNYTVKNSYDSKSFELLTEKFFKEQSEEYPVENSEDDWESVMDPSKNVGNEIVQDLPKSKYINNKVIKQSSTWKPDSKTSLIDQLLNEDNVLSVINIEVKETK